MPDITYDVGRVSFIIKGAWNLATAYEKLDVVSYNGSLYIAKQNVPGGTAISNTTYWQLAVEKGDQGETGNGIASITLTGTAGNVDTYTITFTDGTTTTFTVTNGGVTTVNGRTGDVTGLVEEDGSYPLLNAGTADNLTPYSEDSGASQDIPFIAQGTGCGNGESVVDTGSYCQLKKKLGNMVGVNQLAKELNSTNYSASDASASFSDGVATITASARYGGINQDLIAVPVGHYVFMSATIKLTTASNQIQFLLQFSGGTAASLFTQATTNEQIVSGILSVTGGNATRLVVRDNRASDRDAFTVKNIRVIDLTLWYGSNDRIPSDLISHPENWGRYYSGSLAYNAGTLESADGTKLKSIGRNAWDEETRNGYYNSSTGAFVALGSSLANKNPIPVIPNTTYYSYTGTYSTIVFYYDGDGNFISYGGGVGNSTFTTPANCRFINICNTYGQGGTYNHDITISLYYSGESGYDQYYPHTVLAEVDTGSEVLRSAGAIADEKTPDGTITRKCYEVTYDGSNDENWTAETIVSITTTDKNFYISAPLSKKTVTVRTNRFVSYAIGNAYLVAGQPNAFVSGGGNLNVYFNQGLTDVSALRAYLSSNPLTVIYELATPTTEQGTAFPENIPCDDFGSMYWSQTEGVPQGNEFFYPVDYKASIDTLYNRVGGDMSKIVTEDEYPEAPSPDGTYVLKATVSGGTKTYAWVAE